MFVDKEYILKSLRLYQAERAPNGWNDAMQRAIEVVEDAPNIDVKRGRWLLYPFTSPIGAKCSVCRRISYFEEDEKLPEQCPNCNAYLGGE